MRAWIGDRPEPEATEEAEWHAWYEAHAAEIRKERTVTAVGDYERRFGPQDVHPHDAAEEYDDFEGGKR